MVFAVAPATAPANSSVLTIFDFSWITSILDGCLAIGFDSEATLWFTTTTTTPGDDDGGGDVAVVVVDVATTPVPSNPPAAARGADRSNRPAAALVHAALPPSPTSPSTGATILHHGALLPPTLSLSPWLPPPPRCWLLERCTPLQRPLPGHHQRVGELIRGERREGGEGRGGLMR